MGFYGNDNWKTAQDVHKAINEEFFRGSTVLGQEATNGGLHLWTASEDKHGRVIYVHFVEELSGVWSYKEVSENMEPFAYDCPLRLLKLVPETSKWACPTWRVKVKEFWATQTS